MKDNNLQHLIEKYESGHSSIDEEQMLFKQNNPSGAADNLWFKFVKSHKTSAPTDFNEELWQKFDRKTQSTRKLFTMVISVAASIVLILTLFFGYKSQQNDLSFEEKAVLLKKAKAMLLTDDEMIAKEDIIYEDNTIVIYLNYNN